MKKFVVGVKKGMTQLFDADGVVHPVTVVSIPPVTVTQVKSKEKDGYVAVQVGYGVQKDARVNQAQKKKGSFKGFKEFRMDDSGAHAVGAAVGVDQFAAGDLVQVSGLTKGKGFQGVVKRHGFHGGPRSHGQKHSEREAGSIGGGPGRAGGRVVRGMRMAGRMGADRVTVKNLKVIRVDSDTNELLIEGALPGRAGTLVEIVQK
ncbi:MAG: Ribosomal protein large subunit ribosomal protein [Candidatus Parcubacteria bacterium]|jgi:large subunit ribosomal protein L3